MGVHVGSTTRSGVACPFSELSVWQTVEVDWVANSISMSIFFCLCFGVYYGSLFKMYKRRKEFKAVKIEEDRLMAEKKVELRAQSLKNHELAKQREQTKAMESGQLLM